MVSIRPHSSATGHQDPSESLALGRSHQADLPTADLPTMHDLPSENPEEPGLPDEYHDLQPQLLSRTLNLATYSRKDWFTGSDLNLYYDVQHQRWYKRPDWFLSVGVPRLYNGEELRRSYVVWQEGKSPDVVVEFLSAGTAAEDLGRFIDPSASIDSGEIVAGERVTGEMITAATERTIPAEVSGEPTDEKPPSKFDVYETYLRVPHYIVYSRYSQRLRYFRWYNGAYHEQALRPQAPLIWLDDLAIGLGIWQGEFDQADGNWLRWCDANGNWLLTDTEEERRAKEEERSAKEQAELQVLQGARHLLTLGMDLAEVVQVMGLSEAQVAILRSPSPP